MSTVSFSTLGKAGRAGNQFFQIAATVAYAKKHNKFFAFPEWEYNKFFKNKLPASNIVVDKTFNEPAFEYNEIPLIGGDFDIQGYYQSYKHFENINVSELFELTPEWRKHVDDLYHKINPHNLPTISIHHRFGDYLIEPHASYHGVLPIEYYDKAVKTLYPNVKDVKNVMNIICSDDIERAKKLYDYRFSNFYFSEGENEIVDLFLMAKCTDNIIANSSYSWWSAYLNQNPNKRVVAPKKWFAGANLNTKDLIPQSWITI